MDETAPPPTTATSTSAAAMADSASTKISGGLGGPPPGASAKATTSVKLVIKSSNQQYEDQAIDSDPLWTVKQLKAHIAAVYPSKPDVADQKLIYSGQLLNDSACIKDVIRSYKDVYTQNHVIHLVCANKLNPNLRIPSSAAPRMANATMNGAAAPAGENRSNGSATAASASHDQQVPQGYPFTLPPHMAQHQQRNGTPQQMIYLDAMRQMQQMQQQSHTMPHNPFAYATPWNAQQMAAGQYYQWMHHMYNQYMQQYNQMATNPFPLHGNPHPFMSSYTPHGSPVIPPSGPSATAAAAAPPVGTAAAPPAAPAEPQAEGEVAVAGPAADVPARRFPNIVQDEEEDPRDWLELFFTMTRLAIFLTILYFNSSPLRCLAVCTIGLGIYFYHTRLFVRRAERNNNNINRNNNAADAAEQIQQGVRQVQHAQAQAEQQQEQPEGEPAQPADADQALRRRITAGDAADEADGEATPGAEPAVTAVTSQTDNNNNNASVISVVRTFVVTFFTSLLPETPAL